MVEIRAMTGDAVKAILPEMAALRIQVFREWPYLYDGTIDYEKDYLSHFIAAPEHVVICAIADGAPVGMATASPLSAQHEEFRQPLADAGQDPREIFYFGESVLLPAFRGQGIGHKFFDGREAHALALGYGKTAFCGVVRPADHPLRSPIIKPLDPFWRKRGYRPLEGVVGHFSWRDIGDMQETQKPMQFWGRGF